MRSTFFGFETAKRGLSINQKGLDITGHNLTNINTAGYTRQRIDVVSLSMQGSGSKYPISSVSYSGMGANISGVSQMRDPFLDRRFREENSDMAYFNQSAAILSDIEGSLDEVAGTGLQNSINKLNEALSNFSANPDQATHANIVLTTTKNLVLNLKQYSEKLNDVMNQQKYDLEVSVNTINSSLKKVAELNKTIANEVFTTKEYQTGAYSPNELLDQRNLLLDQLSQYGDLNVQSEKDGTVTVKLNGRVCIQGSDCEQLMMSESSNNDSVSLNWLSDGEKLRDQNGSLKAYVDMINGSGVFAVESGENANYAKGVPYYKHGLDMIASALVNAFNSTIPDCDKQGTDHEHTQGENVQYKELLTTLVDGKVTAQNLQISQNWLDDVSYIIPPSCAVGGEKNNEHILNLKNKLTEDYDFVEFKGGVSEYINFYNGTIGQEKSYYSNRLTTTASVVESLGDSRDAISGVSTDEEGTNLMLFDKAYKALGRLMTTMDEALDVLINKTGTVGR